MDQEQPEEVLMWRFPMADQEIQYGGSLTVREAQAAIFVNEGRGADVFGPLSLEGSLAARQVLGGTAPAQVRAQVARHRARLAG